jgi:hypothetical protein
MTGKQYLVVLVNGNFVSTVCFHLSSAKHLLYRQSVIAGIYTFKNGGKLGFYIVLKYLILISFICSVACTYAFLKKKKNQCKFSAESMKFSI